MYYFIYGRQIITTINAFVLGMFVAKYSDRKIMNIPLVSVLISLIIMIYLIFAAYDFVPFFSGESINSHSLKGVFWYGLLEIDIAYLLFSLCNCKYKENIIYNLILKISKHEYSIYVWHLLFLNAIMTYSDLYLKIIQLNYYLAFIIILCILIILGIIIDLIIGNINFSSIIKKGD